MTVALILAALVFATTLVMLQNIHSRKVIMAAIDDLKAADAAEAQTLTILAKAQQDEVTALEGFIATLQNSPDSATVEAVAASMTARVANMQTIADALNTAAATVPLAPTS